MVPAVSRLHHPSRLVSFALWPAAFGFGLLSLLIARSHPGEPPSGAGEGLESWLWDKLTYFL